MCACVSAFLRCLWGWRFQFSSFRKVLYQKILLEEVALWEKEIIVATDPLKPKRGCCPNLFFRKSLNEMYVFLGVV